MTCPLSPGSYEALAAIEKVRLKMNPSTRKSNTLQPAWSVKKPRVRKQVPNLTNTCLDCGTMIHRLSIRCGTCNQIVQNRRRSGEVTA